LSPKVLSILLHFSKRIYLDLKVSPTFYLFSNLWEVDYNLSNLKRREALIGFNNDILINSSESPKTSRTFPMIFNLWIPVFICRWSHGDSHRIRLHRPVSWTGGQTRGRIHQQNQTDGSQIRSPDRQRKTVEQTLRNFTMFDFCFFHFRPQIKLNSPKWNVQCPERWFVT